MEDIKIEKALEVSKQGCTNTMINKILSTYGILVTTVVMKTFGSHVRTPFHTERTPQSYGIDSIDHTCADFVFFNMVNGSKTIVELISSLTNFGSNEAMMLAKLEEIKNRAITQKLYSGAVKVVYAFTDKVRNPELFKETINKIQEETGIKILDYTDTVDLYTMRNASMKNVEDTITSINDMITNIIRTCIYDGVTVKAEDTKSALSMIYAYKYDIDNVKDYFNNIPDMAFTSVENLVNEIHIPIGYARIIFGKDLEDKLNHTKELVSKIKKELRASKRQSYKTISKNTNIDRKLVINVAHQEIARIAAKKAKATKSRSKNKFNVAH